MKKTTIHKFVYSREDVINLIKGDIASKMGMKTLPIISHDFWFDIKNIADDHGPGYTQVFDNVRVEVEVPG